MDDEDTIDAGAPVRSSGETVRHEWDPSEDPSMAVVETVAAATGRTMDTLEPLQNYVDVDALDALVASAATSETAVSLSFSYSGTSVVVTGEAVEVSLDERS